MKAAAEGFYPSQVARGFVDLQTGHNPVCLHNNTSRGKGFCEAFTKTVLFITRQLFSNHFIMLNAHDLHSPLTCLVTSRGSNKAQEMMLSLRLSLQRHI